MSFFLCAGNLCSFRRFFNKQKIYIIDVWERGRKTNSPSSREQSGGNGNGNEPGDETNQLETRQKSERRKKYSQWYGIFKSRWEWAGEKWGFLSKGILKSDKLHVWKWGNGIFPVYNSIFQLEFSVEVYL